jgi:hemoglobin
MNQSRDDRNKTSETTSLYQRVGGREGIARLLRLFYADVRQHQVIGPVFNERIKDWPAHIAKISEFWARVTGGPSAYSGQTPLKHLSLGLEPHHFAAWLALWDANCRSYLQPREAEEMSRLAHEIGRRLRSIVSRENGYRPGV